MAGAAGRAVDSGTLSLCACFAMSSRQSKDILSSRCQYKRILSIRILIIMFAGYPRTPIPATSRDQSSVKAPLPQPMSVDRKPDGGDSHDAALVKAAGIGRTDQRIHVGADDQVKDDWLPKPTIPILGQAIALPPHTRGHPTRWTIFQRRLPWPFGTWAADPHRDAKSPRRRSISNCCRSYRRCHDRCIGVGWHLPRPRDEVL